jgi:hypothetical protein
MKIMSKIHSLWIEHYNTSHRYTLLLPYVMLINICIQTAYTRCSAELELLHGELNEEIKEIV